MPKVTQISKLKTSFRFTLYSSFAQKLLGHLKPEFKESLWENRNDWLVGCFGFNGPLRQFFSLYHAVSQREGERGEKGSTRVKM